VTSAFAKPPKRLFNRWLVVKYLGFFLLIAAAIGTAYYVLGTRSHISPTPQLKEESYKAYRNGDFRGAIVKLTAYLKNNGSDQEARNVLITSYAQVGDLKAALKENETLVKAKPHDAGALPGRSTIQPTRPVGGCYSLLQTCHNDRPKRRAIPLPDGRNVYKPEALRQGPYAVACYSRNAPR